MRNKLKIAKFLVGLSIFAGVVSAQGDKFRFCVLKHDGIYLPHPDSPESILMYIKSTTSIDPPLKEVAVEIGAQIFDYPFLYLSAKGTLPEFTKKEIEFLFRHLNAGGFLLIDEAENYGLDDFYFSVKEFAKQIFPDLKFEKISPDDVIFKSFYLRPKVAGRVNVSPYLFGIKKDGRWVIVYSRYDLLGAWAREEYGKFMYECSPGGEAQRLEAMKLTVNIIMYSLTGTYKQDIIHKEFIERKLKTW
jgi:hypothetical protein